MVNRGDERELATFQLKLCDFWQKTNFKYETKCLVIQG